MFKQSEGVWVTHPPDVKSMNYTENDMKIVFDNAHPHSWDDAIGWVKKDAESEHKLGEGQAIALNEDLERLKESSAPFVDNYKQAFTMAHRGRK